MTEELKPRFNDGVILPSLTWNKAERLIRAGKFKIWGIGSYMAMTRVMLEDAGVFDEALGGGGPLRSSQGEDADRRHTVKCRDCVRATGVACVA